MICCRSIVYTCTVFVHRHCLAPHVKSPDPNVPVAFYWWRIAAHLRCHPIAHVCVATSRLIVRAPAIDNAIVDVGHPWSTVASPRVKLRRAEVKIIGRVVLVLDVRVVKCSAICVPDHIEPGLGAKVSLYLARPSSSHGQVQTEIVSGIDGITVDPTIKKRIKDMSDSSMRTIATFLPTASTMRTLSHVLQSSKVFTPRSVDSSTRSIWHH
eukprot:SAG31_NODE_343_length_17426_cov_35.294443_16_plen_211_part_00